MDDTIYRQAAIDTLENTKTAISEDGERYIAKQNAIMRIDALPPAEPQIIRCKDCKHWDGVDTCDVIDAPVWDNDFCSMAERRSDE